MFGPISSPLTLYHSHHSLPPDLPPPTHFQTPPIHQPHHFTPSRPVHPKLPYPSHQPFHHRLRCALSHPSPPIEPIFLANHEIIPVANFSNVNAFLGLFRLVYLLAYRHRHRLIRNAHLAPNACLRMVRRPQPKSSNGTGLQELPGEAPYRGQPVMSSFSEGVRATSSKRCGSGTFSCLPTVAS